MKLLPSFLALFAVALGYGALVPLAPALAQTTMRDMASAMVPLHTGALTAAYLFALAACAPLWGRLIDRSPRARIAAIGLMGFSLSFMVLGATSNVVALYAGAVLAGSFAGAIVPAVQAQVATVEGEAGQARTMTRFGAASFTGWFLGPPLATWGMARARGMEWPPGTLAFAAVVASGIVAAIAMFVAIPDHRLSRMTATGAQEARTGARLFLALGMAITVGVGAFEVSLMLWSVQVLKLDDATMSRMLVECTVVMMVAQSVITLVPGARPRWNTTGAVFALVATAAAIGSTPWLSSSFALFASVAVIAVGATVLQAMIALGTIRMAGSAVASVLGVQLALSSVAQGAGSFSAGLLFTRSGTGFLVPAAILAIAALLLLRPANRSFMPAASPK